MDAHRLRRGLLAALLSLSLLAGLTPGAAAQSTKLCTSPTPVPERTPSLFPPVNVEDAITFAFAQNSYTTHTSGAGTATVTVTRTGTRAASVDYETGDRTLTAPGGYTHTAGTLHFAAGETSKSFTVPVSGAPGQFRVFLSNVTDGGAVCAGSARPWGSEVRVGPRQPPGLSLSRSSLTVAENGSATYTVRLDSWPIGGDVTVTITGMSGTDVTVDTDSHLTGDQDTLTFTATTWSRPRTVTLSAGGDTDATDDSVTLTHTASGANYGSVTGSLFVTVNDDYSGTPLIDFTRTSIATSEGETAVIRVRKIGSGAASVDYATSDGSPHITYNAAQGTHYTAASGTLTFAAGDTEKTVTVAITDDGVVDVDTDRDRGFTVTLSNPGTGAALGSRTVATVTIRQPRFEFTSANYYVREDRGPAVVTVRKIGPGPGGVEWLTIAEGRPFAEPPGDRPILEDQVLEFAAGETEKTFTVPIVDDGVPEYDEKFGVALRVPPHRGELGKNRALVTIRNWPPAPVIRFKGQESRVPETHVQENAGTATLTVVKTGGATSETVTVDYSIPVPDHPGPGLALPPGDYTDVSGTLSFAPSETEKTITIPIIDDDIDEPRENLWVWLQNPSGAVFDLEVQALNNLLLQHVNLIDDDPPPVVGFASAAQTVHEGDGTATLTVTKTGATARLVRVDYATADATATAPGDYTETSGTLEFGPSETEKTITVPLASDGTTEDPETFSVALSNPWRATLGRSLTYLLVEDGAAPTGMQVEAAPPVVTISADAASVTEGGDVTFTVSADQPPASDLAVTVSVDEEMGDGHDLIASTQIATVTIPAGQASATWTVTAMSDEVARADGTMTGSIEAGDGYTAGTPSTVTLDLLDDDGTTADSAVGQSTTGTPTVAPDLVAQVRALAAQTQHGDAHVNRWRRVLVAFGLETYAGLTPMTAAEARANAEKYSSPLWPEIAKILAVLEGAATLPVVTLSAGAGVTEGSDAVFTLTASPAPASALPVSVTVATSGDFGVSAGSRTVTFNAGESTATLTLSTADDNADEPDGSVTVSLSSGEGYVVAAGPALYVDDATLREGEAWVMAFTVRLSPAAPGPVSVHVSTQPSDPKSAEPGVDYSKSTSQLLFRAGETAKTVNVLVYDDSHDEDPETFQVVLSKAQGATIGDGVAVGTITNDDPLPAAWLARFGRAVAEQALDGIAGRMAAPRTPGMQGTLAGQALDFGAPSDAGSAQEEPAPEVPGGTAAHALSDVAQAFGGHPGAPGVGLGEPPAPSHTLTARDALVASRFSLTGEADGGGSFAFWGWASQGYFDGTEQGDGTDVTLDGTVTTGMLGADYARGQWLLGLALMQSSADGGYTGGCSEADGAAPCGGDVEASLTAAVPYALLEASERLRIWTALGYGTGDVTLGTGMGGRLEAGTDWQMAALGMRGDVFAPSAGPGLALTSDALWTRTQSAAVQGLASSDSSVTRLRLGLEGNWAVSLSGLGTLTPKLEMGLRHDGGDAETGFGVELGGGIAWLAPAYGLSLSLEGRTLVAHETDLEDSGVSVALSFDPDPASARGPSVSLRQSVGGSATGGVAALFGSQALVRRAGTGEMGGLLSAEASWGFATFGGRFTGSPHVSYALSDVTRDYTLGWRLSLPKPEPVASAVSFGVAASQREHDGAATEHVVGLEVRSGW